MLPRTSGEAVTACFFLVMLAMACLMPVQNDTWWHLRAGKEMWTRGFIMLHDEFSFTTAGSHWPNHEWLTEIVFYAVFSIAGLPGLTLLAAACVTLALILSWRLMEGTPGQRVLFMGLAMVSIAPVWTIRPHVFTLPFLLTVIHLVLRERYWPIPLLFVVWANLHGGVALGLVALGAMIAGRFYLSGTSRLKPLLVVAAASFLATCITPLGASLWWTIPESIHKSTVNRIVEWSAPSLLDSSYIAFWAAVTSLLATTWMERRSLRNERHLQLVAVALALMVLALRSRRNIPPFLLVAVPVLTLNLAERLSWLRDGRGRENPAWNRLAVVACAAACALIVAAAWTGPAARLQWQPLPQQVVDEVEACGDRVYNRYPDGGYVIWFAPRVRVFIDSRQDPYPLSFVQDYVRLEETGDYRSTFDKYTIRCALLPESSLVAARLRDDGWKTRVETEGWIVLEGETRGGGIPGAGATLP